jgi:peptide/nickel transport system ATP-binding protein
MSNSEILVEVTSLTKHFPFRQGMTLRPRNLKMLRAVDGVTFGIREREVLGLVGESGCGKTTTGKLLVRLLDPSSGEIRFRDKPISPFRGKDLKNFRKSAQIIFQDPYESLNPRKTVFDSVSQPLYVHGILDSKEQVRDRVLEILKMVKLEREGLLAKFPHELSGGERQRVATARALVLQPSFVVADEPVSMLDVSIRAEIIELLKDLGSKYSLTYLFITHDLAVARYMCDRIGVMYLGKIVELGETEEVLADPLHPYTKMLLSSVAVPDPEIKRGVEAVGEVPSLLDLPSGCRFHPRCPIRVGICDSVSPELVEIEKGRWVACHVAVEKHPSKR